MSFFVVLLPKPNPEFVDLMRERFRRRVWEYTPQAYILASRATVDEVSERLGLRTIRKPDVARDYAAFVGYIGQYGGTARSEFWDWIRSREEMHYPED